MDKATVLLKEMYEGVVKASQYAESKNGAMIAFNIAAMAAFSLVKIFENFQWMIVIICCSLSISKENSK